jgi:hypothetical protein
MSERGDKDLNLYSEKVPYSAESGFIPKEGEGEFRIIFKPLRQF